MLYMPKRHQPHRDEMSAQGHPLVFNKRRGNLHTTMQAAAGLRHPYTQVQRERVALIYSSNIKIKLKVKTKQDIER